MLSEMVGVTALGALASRDCDCPTMLFKQVGVAFISLISYVDPTSEGPVS
jgi:hypothetical protein